MKYLEAVVSDDRSSPSSIYFEASTPASDYSFLLNNIRAGITPSLIIVGLRHNFHDKGSPVAYDYGPDASRMIWRNAIEKTDELILKSLSFNI